MDKVRKEFTTPVGRLCAVVVPKPGAELGIDQVAAYFESRGAAVFKRPERLRVVHALPRNPVGKVVRAELLRIAAAPANEETGK